MAEVEVEVFLAREEKTMGVHAMDSSSAQLDDLPESCIFTILSFTTPMDACRLSVVNKLFRSAICCDTLWEKWLSVHYQQILSTALSPIHFSSKKELYFHLCQPILIDGGTKMFWMDRSTAKICYMLSARELSIIWSHEHHFWIRASRSSRVDVRGEFDCRLLSANTEYVISFVINFGSRPSTWNVAPLKFGIKTGEGDEKECGWMLKESEEVRLDPNTRIAPLIERDDGRLEIIAGEFMTKEGTLGCIEFWMKEVKSGRWKIGLHLDGVIIKPKSILEESKSKTLPNSSLLRFHG